MATDKKTRIRYVRSSHWTTIKWETGSWFTECRGFLVCLKQQTLEWSQNLFITLPTELGTVIPNRIQPFHGGSIYLLWKDCFPGGRQVCIMEFCSFISPKVSLRSLRSWVEDSSPPTFPLLPVSKIMLKNRAEKLAEGTRGAAGDGGNEWNKMDYEFENCQLSCIIQLRALAQWSATIQIFQLKWLYIQASKLTIK